jgi:hypothetical protein
MAMMDKQISNDLEAQKATKAGAENFLRLAQAHQLQQAQISQMGKQGQLTEAETKNQLVEAQQKAFALAQSHMMLSSYHDLVQQTNKMPEGPAKQAQLQRLGLVYQATLGKIANVNDMAAGAAAYYGMAQNGMNGGTGSQAPTSPVNYGKMNQLERASQMKLPGAPTEADMGNMTTEAKTVETARSLRDSYNNSFDKLNQMALAGKLSPNQRDAYVTELAAKIGQATGSTAADAHKEADAMFPQPNDWGNTRNVKRSQGQKFFDNMEAATPTLNRFGLKNPPKAQQQQSAPPEQRTTKSGRVGLYDPKSKAFLGWK